MVFQRLWRKNLRSIQWNAGEALLPPCSAAVKVLWTAIAALRHNFIHNNYLFEIASDFVAVVKVDTALGSGPITTHTRSVERGLALAPAVEACGRIGPHGEGKKRSQGV